MKQCETGKSGRYRRKCEVTETQENCRAGDSANFVAEEDVIDECEDIVCLGEGAFPTSAIDEIVTANCGLG